MPLRGIKSENVTVPRMWQHINLQLSDDLVTFDMADGVMTLTTRPSFLIRDIHILSRVKINLWLWLDRKVLSVT